MLASEARRPAHIAAELHYLRSGRLDKTAGRALLAAADERAAFNGGRDSEKLVSTGESDRRKRNRKSPPRRLRHKI